MKSDRLWTQKVSQIDLISCYNFQWNGLNRFLVDYFGKFFDFSRYMSAVCCLKENVPDFECFWAIFGFNSTNTKFIKVNKVNKINVVNIVFIFWSYKIVNQSFIVMITSFGGELSHSWFSHYIQNQCSFIFISCSTMKFLI